jgi:hypothetical protein
MRVRVTLSIHLQNPVIQPGKPMVGGADININLNVTQVDVISSKKDALPNTSN